MTIEHERDLATLKALIRANRLPGVRNLIAIVGTSCSGKTGMLTALEEHRGFICHVGHESFTSLHAAGMPLPDQRSSHQVRLAAYATMVQHLTGENRVAVQRNAQATVVDSIGCFAAVDRSLIDVAQYLPDGLAEVEEILGMSQGEIMGRYRLIIHLEHPSLETYLRAWKGNPARVAAGPPDYGRVLKCAEMLKALYGSLPNKVFIPRETDWMKRFERVVRAILD